MIRYAENQRVRVAVELFLDHYRQELNRSFEKCESPIEQLMALNLHVFRDLYKNADPFYVTPQARIGNYRVDFLLTAVKRDTDPIEKVYVVIECDGHEFHERTKEQAKKDKESDRFLQSQGYKVLRFTGSEIWQNPAKCAVESINILLSEWGGADAGLGESLSFLSEPRAI